MNAKLVCTMQLVSTMKPCHYETISLTYMVQGGGGSLLHGRRGQVEALWWEAGIGAIT